MFGEALGKIHMYVPKVELKACKSKLLLQYYLALFSNLGKNLKINNNM